MLVVSHNTSLRPIDHQVVRDLNGLAEQLLQEGLELFVFGSVAETYPLARRGADLDLGFAAIQWIDEHDKTSRIRELRQQLDDLPTIRPIDLVDFDTVEPSFKELALRSQLNFPLDEHGGD